MELALLLLAILGIAHSYPNGAPPGICSLDPQEPKHGFHQPQKSTPPYDIKMSKDHVTSLDDTIKVTIKSRPGGPKFKGFLVLATDDNKVPIGTWENDDWSHPLSCGATTHDKKTEKDEVVLTWKPLVKATQGKVHMKAVIVENFATFWTDIPVSTSGASGVPSVQKPSQITEAPPKALSTTPKSNTAPPKGGVALPGLVPASTAPSKVSSTPGKSVTVTPTTTTPVPTTTKRRSLINRLFGGGGQSSTPTTKKTTTPKPTTTTTTTPKPTTTTTTPKPTTTPTSKKPGFLSGLFGGNSRKATTTPTTTTTTTTPRPTTTPTTTTKASAAQSQQALANNEGSIKIPGQDAELISTTVPTTTKKSGLRRIFG